jgi:hypothetical protein
VQQLSHSPGDILLDTECHLELQSSETANYSSGHWKQSF